MNIFENQKINLEDNVQILCLDIRGRLLTCLLLCL